MNDIDILKAAQAQAEKEEMGEYEKAQFKKGISDATAAIVIACVIMVLAEMVIFHKPDFGKPAIIVLLSVCLNFSEWKITKKKKTLAVIIGESIFFLVCLILYVGELFL